MPEAPTMYFVPEDVDSPLLRPGDHLFAYESVGGPLYVLYREYGPSENPELAALLPRLRLLSGEDGRDWFLRVER